MIDMLSVPSQPEAARSPSRPRATISDVPPQLRGLAAIALLVAFIVFLYGLHGPLLGFHSFRQSQTAIATYWMLHGSSLLAYETPVLGYPWSIPFEFPLYNWLVLGLVKATGQSIDSAGRIISFCWLLLCLWPARDLFRSQGLPSKSFVLFTALFLASPLYLYWGRTFLMETQAVFFCLSFLAAVVRQARGDSPWWALVSALAGTAGALTKVTTLLPFLALAVLICGLRLLSDLRSSRPVLLPLLLSGLSLGVPLLAFSTWNKFADELKSHNAIAKLFQSSTPEMVAWNFGPLRQRLSGDMARAVSRGALDAFGPLVPLLIVAVVVVCAKPNWLAKSTRWVVLALCAAFALPWLVFTNLYIAHNYYQVANGVLAIAAVTLVLSALADRLPKVPSLALFGAVLVSQYAWFGFRFAPMLAPDPAKDIELSIARYVKDHTAERSSIAIYGLDWSSLVAYYSERRAIMEPSRMVQAKQEQYLARMAVLLEPVGGLPMSAVVRCPSLLDHDPEAVRLFDALDARTNAVSIGHCRVYIAR